MPASFGGGRLFLSQVQRLVGKEKRPHVLNTVHRSRPSDQHDPDAHAATGISRRQRHVPEWLYHFRRTRGRLRSGALLQGVHVEMSSVFMARVVCRGMENAGPTLACAELFIALDTPSDNSWTAHRRGFLPRAQRGRHAANQRLVLLSPRPPGGGTTSLCLLFAPRFACTRSCSGRPAPRARCRSTRHRPTTETPGLCRYHLPRRTSGDSR